MTVAHREVVVPSGGQVALETGEDVVALNLDPGLRVLDVVARHHRLETGGPEETQSGERRRERVVRVQSPVVEGRRVDEREELAIARIAAGVAVVVVRLVVRLAAATEQVEVVVAEGGHRLEDTRRDHHLHRRITLVGVIGAVVVPEGVQRGVGRARHRRHAAEAADRQAGVAADAEHAVDARIEVLVGGGGRRRARLVAQETELRGGQTIDEAEAQRLTGHRRTVVVDAVVVLVGDARVDRAARPVTVGDHDLFALRVLGADGERAALTHPAPSRVDHVLGAVGVLGREAGVVDLEAVEGLLGDDVDDAGDRIGAVHRGRAVLQDLGALDQRARDRGEVDGVGRTLHARRRPAAAVDEHERTLGAETTQRDLLGTRTTVEQEALEGVVDLLTGSGGRAAQDLLGADETGEGRTLRGDDLDRRCRVEVGATDARTGDDDLFSGRLVGRRFGLILFRGLRLGRLGRLGRRGGRRLGTRRLWRDSDDGGRSEQAQPGLQLTIHSGTPSALYVLALAQTGLVQSGNSTDRGVTPSNGSRAVEGMPSCGI